MEKLLFYDLFLAPSCWKICLWDFFYNKWKLDGRNAKLQDKSWIFFFYDFTVWWLGIKLSISNS